MHTSEKLSRAKIFGRASRRQRLWAAAFFVAVAAGFAACRLAADNKISLERWVNPCGFRQRYDLPCPTCGMTSATLAFVCGRIFQAFYIQPAAALFCCALAVATVFAFIMAATGVYFTALGRFLCGIGPRRMILLLLLIIAAGWAVTLARAIA